MSKRVRSSQVMSKRVRSNEETKLDDTFKRAKTKYQFSKIRKSLGPAGGGMPKWNREVRVTPTH